MDNFQKNLSFDLKNYRALNKLSQEAAAEDMGISTVFLSELECCKKAPSCETLIRLYRHMGYDYIPLNQVANNNETLHELFSILSNRPDVSETLLDIAKLLTKDNK